MTERVRRRASPSRPLVLVADNDVAVSALLTEVLSRQGLSIVTVGDGRAALETLDRERVDLLVCDLDMPGLGGREVLQDLEHRAAAPPALVISGFLDPVVERQLQAMRTVRGVFRKPFDVIEFASVARALASGEAAEGEA